MQEQLTATLTTIFSEVLADLAFMFNDETDADPAVGAQWLETTISYAGPKEGTLRLRCTREFSISLAANLLGTDPEDDNAETIASDAVKEFMNIVCGQLVTALHGTEAVFNLTIPEITQLQETPDFSRVDDVQSSTVSIEGQLVQLSYFPECLDRK